MNTQAESALSDGGERDGGADRSGKPLRISRETVRQLALGVDQYVVTRARFGRTTADLTRAPRGPGVRTTRPLERVEVDHFLLDVHLLCHKTGRRLGRPWLTVLVDHFSGAVLGYHVSFATPSAASVLAALRHAVLPKTPVPEPPAMQ
jgi:putative transposase